MKNIVFYLFLACIFTGCFRERIEIDNNTGDNKRIIISAWLTADDRPQNVFLSYSINYFGNDAVEKITGASVTVEGRQTIHTLEETADGTYTITEDWNPVVGENYTLSCLIDGKEYKATQLLRPCPEIDNLRFNRLSEDIVGDSIEQYSVVFDFQDIIGLGDGYYGSTFEKGYAARDSFINGLFTDDAFEDEANWTDIEMLFHGEPYELGDTAVVEVHSIGDDAVHYMQDIIDEIFRDELFGGPPANVRSNFDGGALGYFILADVKNKEIVIE